MPGKTIAYLQKATNSKKKYKVTIIKPNGKKCTVQFGAAGYSDYTKHKDKERKERYISRHKSRENWTKSGICTAGFWSRYLLWGKPTLTGSISAIQTKFKIKIKRGKAPIASPKRKNTTK